jgi:hypothetical protein
MQHLSQSKPHSCVPEQGGHTVFDMLPSQVRAAALTPERPSSILGVSK